MPDAWFMILMVLGLLIFGGTLFGFWIMRVVATKQEKEELTAADLHLLQETVESLIERLKTASDEAVMEIETRQRELQALLDRVDLKLKALELQNLKPDDVQLLAQEGIEKAEIAQRSGMNRGEVELMLELQALGRKDPE